MSQNYIKKSDFSNKRIINWRSLVGFIIKIWFFLLFSVIFIANISLTRKLFKNKSKKTGPFINLSSKFRLSCDWLPDSTLLFDVFDLAEQSLVKLHLFLFVASTGFNVFLFFLFQVFNPIIEFERVIHNFLLWFGFKLPYLLLTGYAVYLVHKLVFLDLALF